MPSTPPRKPPASLLDAVVSEDTRRKMKQTTTKVVTRDGKVFEERRSQHGAGEMVRTYKGTEKLPGFLTNPTIQELPWFEFGGDTNTWDPHLHPPGGSSAGGSQEISTYAEAVYDSVPCEKPLTDFAVLQGDQLKVISFNVWFDSCNFGARLQRLLEILREENAHVVCLQEVTPFFMKLFLKSEFIRNKYALTENTVGSTVTPYGVMICVDKRVCPISRVRICKLPTNLGRRLVQCEIRLRLSSVPADHYGGNPPEKASRPCPRYFREVSMWVHTVHLESPLDSVGVTNQAGRIAQLNQIFKDFIETGSNAVFMGDMNFDDGDPENEHIPADFADCWTVYSTNQGLSVTDNCQTFLGRARLDKMYYRFVEVKAAIQEFRKLGVSYMPSDHLGILCVFTLST